MVQQQKVAGIEEIFEGLKCGDVSIKTRYGLARVGVVFKKSIRSRRACDFRNLANVANSWLGKTFPIVG